MYSNRRLAALAIAVVGGAVLGAALFTGVARAHAPDPGTGFVGTAEVRTPFGWNAPSQRLGGLLHAGIRPIVHRCAHLGRG
ncbi:hypothetical protein GCM10010492_38210 [Saccharothrix mutabilis subsp. mutabilis]|uniref:Uncharacterized protein n=1 Tax=Saccharothrix mutabilis subsp. mutabilis TaxID=66855 RepID=A0ABP3DLC7_9PSEU